MPAGFLLDGACRYKFPNAASRCGDVPVACGRLRSEAPTRGCKPKPSKIASKWISDFHSLVQPSFADIGSISRPLYLLWQKNSDRSRCGAGKPGTARRRRKAPSNPQIMDSIRLDPEMLWQTACRNFRGFGLTTPCAIRAAHEPPVVCHAPPTDH
jgi:hypothetical protein